ncbi:MULTISPECIES: hypothetical protein [Mycolicibacterium]|uniref:Uncharacterized protein n=1 Tax=Mycolicibacterium phocaicum TaxID=319706 RepID=A0A7I7ZXJ8_9MYCO|nr:MULTISPECIES: hypothetical protein [Mycolicibacterium]RUP30881.1 MAG: hypothetical protein EKK51_15660 [Mycolicibacterium sp.]TLH64726.1 hypothetical protein C1S79_19075 [Mycolicibacterium phocaicum]UCZ58993.1 hypothetical protein LHJ73_19885 [Mycolicibacterium phocaicum]BBZ58452.1 hypothetical protein MPHO_54440 [Mycolicibacterium phocaicum]
MTDDRSAIELLVSTAARDNTGDARFELFQKLIGVELYYQADKKTIDGREMTSTPVRKLNDGSYAMRAFTSKKHPDLPRSFVGARCPELFSIATDLVDADWLVIVNLKNDLVAFSRDQLRGMFIAPQASENASQAAGAAVSIELERAISQAVQTDSETWYDPVLTQLRSRELYLHLADGYSPGGQPTMLTSNVGGREGWIRTFTTRSRPGIRYGGITWEALVNMVRENPNVPGVQVVNDADDWIVLGRDVM